MTMFAIPMLAAILAVCDFTAKIDWDNLDSFSFSNLKHVRTPVKGIVVDHHGLGCAVFGKSAAKGFEEMTAEDGARGIVWIHPHYNPWAWMNDGAVKLTDRLIEVVLGHYGLPANTPVCSSGGSMGGLGALVFARYSRHNVRRVVSNCGVTDLVYHYSERPDTARTIVAAFADAPDFDAAVKAHSPLHLALAGKMPNIDYVLFHSDKDTGVNKERHGDKLAAALKASVRSVEYNVSVGTGHTELKPELVKRYYDSIRETFE